MASFKRKRDPSSASAFVLGPYRPPRPIKRRRAFVPYARRASAAGELKFHDVDLNDGVIANGGTITPSICLIAQGVTESERVGRKCTIKSVNWRYQVSLPEFDAAGTPATPTTVRFIVYLDKQCNGAAAVTTDLLETADIHSFRNLSNTGRFMFMLDKVITLNYITMASDGAGVVSGGEVFREFTFFKQCSLPIEFNGTTGVIGEIRSNNIGVCVVGLSGAGALNSKFRLRFSDN